MITVLKTNNFHFLGTLYQQRALVFHFPFITNDMSARIPNLPLTPTVGRPALRLIGQIGNEMIKLFID
jgi:hypothetical protein